MPRSIRISRQACQPAESVDEQVARISSMSIGELRQLWKERYAPASFSKDLLARAIAYQLQEEAYGGLSAATARLLKSLAKPGAEQPRRVQVGSVIVREHKGVLHEVMVVPGGFCWRGETYDSLSTIARKITGVSWNGPRFFGLRSRKDSDTGADSSETAKRPSVSQGTQGASKRTGSSEKPKSAGKTGRRSSIRTGGWR